MELFFCDTFEKNANIVACLTNLETFVEGFNTSNFGFYFAIIAIKLDGIVD
jgi:hypothetical protein